MHNFYDYFSSLCGYRAKCLWSSLPSYATLSMLLLFSLIGGTAAAFVGVAITLDPNWFPFTLVISFFLFIVPIISLIKKLISRLRIFNFSLIRRKLSFRTLGVYTDFVLFYYYCYTIIITIIIKIIIKSKTRLVFSNVLTRMTWRNHNSSPVRSHHYQKSVKQSCFLFRISHRRHRKGRESVVREENGSSTKLYIFTLTCFVWINNTTRKIFYISQNTKTSKFYFYYYWEKKMSCTESWSVIVGSIYNNETTY